MPPNGAVAVPQSKRHHHQPRKVHWGLQGVHHVAKRSFNLPQLDHNKAVCRGPEKSQLKHNTLLAAVAPDRCKLSITCTVQAVRENLSPTSTCEQSAPAGVSATAASAGAAAPTCSTSRAASDQPTTSTGQSQFTSWCLQAKKGYGEHWR